jgi:hypothetical protein
MPGAETKGAVQHSLTLISFEGIIAEGASTMPGKAASARVTAKVSAKSVRKAARKKGAHVQAGSQAAEEEFKALIMEYEGKLAFAGCDE